VVIENLENLGYTTKFIIQYNTCFSAITDFLRGFFVFGLKYVVEGNRPDAVGHMALGLVIIAVGSEQLRNILVELFLSIFTGLWKIIQK
jgi:hypothetical protein